LYLAVRIVNEYHLHRVLTEYLRRYSGFTHEYYVAV
jgi:hypothetical protein